MLTAREIQAPVMVRREATDLTSAISPVLQSCRAASEAASQPAALRAALGLTAAGQLLTADQLAAAERRQAERLAAQLAAVQQQLEQGGSEQLARRDQLEARLLQLESTAGQLRQLREDSGRTERRAAGLSAELERLQQDFSDLHRTLLAVQVPAPPRPIHAQFAGGSGALGRRS